MRSSNRRRFLKTTGATIATVTIAGCSGGGGSAENGGSSSSGDGSPTPAETGEDPQTGTATETQSGGNGGSSPQGDAAVVVRNDGGTLKYEVGEGAELLGTTIADGDGEIEKERVLIIDENDESFMYVSDVQNPSAMPSVFGESDLDNDAMGVVATTKEAANETGISGGDGVVGLNPGESIKMAKDGSIIGAEAATAEEIASTMARGMPRDIDGEGVPSNDVGSEAI
jgi:hypothetical protein